MSVRKVNLLIEGQNIKLFYRGREYPGAKSSVVIIPGRNDTSYSYVEFVKELDQSLNGGQGRYNIYALDLAWGNSDIARFEYSKENQALLVEQFVEQYLQKNDQAVHLLGHSMGGEVVLLATMRMKHKPFLKSVISLCPAIYKKNGIEFLDVLAFLHLNFLLRLIISPTYIAKRLARRGVVISKRSSTRMWFLLKNNRGLKRLLSVERQWDYLLSDSKYLEQYNEIKVPVLFFLAKKDEKLAVDTEQRLLKSYLSPSLDFQPQNQSVVLGNVGNRSLAVHRESFHPLHYQAKDIAPVIGRFVESANLGG